MRQPSRRATGGYVAAFGASPLSPGLPGKSSPTNLMGSRPGHGDSGMRASSWAVCLAELTSVNWRVSCWENPTEVRRGIRTK